MHADDDVVRYYSQGETSYLLLIIVVIIANIKIWGEDVLWRGNLRAPHS